MEANYIFVFSLLLSPVHSCGISTHTEVILRALSTYDHPAFGPGQVSRILMEHQGAFQAGAPYPDAFYNSLCVQGQLHGESEDIHWGHYQKVAWDYFRKTYPDPIGNEDAENLFAFLFGIVSHQVADVSWHSLGGLKDGLIRMLADTTFDGSFDSAHNLADFGGDILGVVEWNTSNANEWYVPTKDLHNIFLEYYGSDHGANENVIVACTTMLLAGRTAEQEMGPVLYSSYALQSAIFMDELQDYFLGGIDDMASWTKLAWDESVSMAVNGTDNCHIVSNPLHIHCNQDETSHKQEMLIDREEMRKSKESFFDRVQNSIGMDLNTLAEQTVTVKRHANGVYLKAEPYFDLKGLLDIPRSHDAHEMDNKVNNDEPYATLYVSNPYSKLGWTLHVDDIDGDGNEDLLIGAPGHVPKGSHSQGCVYGLTNWHHIQDGMEVDLDMQADIKLCSSGQFVYERFGQSISTVDINKDGIKDIIVGSPSAGTDSTEYHGLVHVFQGEMNQDNKIVFNPSSSWQVSGDSTRTDTLGWALLKLQDNLVVSGRHRTSHNEDQAGSLFLFKDELIDTDTTANEYDWLGSSISSLLVDQKPVLVASSPIAEHCDSLGICHSGVGKVSLMDPQQNLSLISEILGTSGTGHFEQFGYSVQETSLTIHGKKYEHVLAIGAPTANYGIHTHAGTVYLYDLTDPKEPVYLARLDSDKAFSRFGRSLSFSKDRLLIGSPRYHQASVLEEHGAVFGIGQFVDLPDDRPTEICHVNQPPCPTEWSNLYLLPPGGEKKSHFGHSMRSFQRGIDEFIVVSAPRSSRFAAQSGTIYVYKNA